MNDPPPARPLLGSLTRIADFDEAPFDVRPWPRRDWETADYVLGEVIDASGLSAKVELASGRELRPAVGDAVVGAPARGEATLEAVGGWRDIGEDGVMDAMTAAGLFGRITSISSFVGGVVRLKYLGHVIRNGAKVTMRDFVEPASPGVEYVCPTVLIIGTSMSSGKTTSGRAIVRMLSRSGLRPSSGPS